MNNLDQNVRYDISLEPQDVAAPGAVTTAAGDWKDMRLYRIGSMVCSAQLTAVATASCQLFCADDAAGTNPLTLGAAFLVLLTGGAGGTNEIGSIPFDVDDCEAIAAGKHFVGVEITMSGTGDDCQAILLREAARYAKATMPDR